MVPMIEKDDKYLSVLTKSTVVLNETKKKRTKQSWLHTLSRKEKMQNIWNLTQVAAVLHHLYCDGSQVQSSMYCYPEIAYCLDLR